MERVTASMDHDTLSEIRSIAGSRGVSRFLETAARERLTRLRLLGLLDDLDARHGAASPELRREIALDARRIFRRKIRRRR